MARSGNSIFSFNSIKKNIILAFIAMGAVTLLAASSSYWLANKMQRNEENLVISTRKLYDASQTLLSSIQESTILLLAYNQEHDPANRLAWQRIWDDKINEALSTLEEFETVDGQKLKGTKSITRKVRLIQQSQIQVMEEATAFQKLSNLNTLVLQNQEAQVELEQYMIARRLQLKEATQSSHHIITLIKYAGIAAFILCVALGILLGVKLVAQIMRSLYNVKQIVKELSNGHLPSEVWQSKNEVGYITRELTKLITNLRNVQDFALQVGDGKFNNEVNVFEGQGELGSSLAGMRDSLAMVAEKDQQRNWINEGFAQFADTLRNNNTSIKELSNITISSLVKYLNANQGAIFLINNNKETVETLSLTACYAYDRQKYLNKEVLKGEGLCGQAWQENDLILINDVPEDYVKIRSGLGKANPRSILVMPLSANDITQGVIEIASFTEFEPYQIEFIKRIAENFASAITTARNNERTSNLLAEFQEMTEELRAQEEEMRQNMEELNATQEEMERARTETELKEQNLNSVINNTADTIFALDRDYRITVVNSALRNKYAQMGIDLNIGTIISDLLPKSAWEKWKQRYDRALNGEQYSLVEESSGSNGSRFSHTYHNPIRNDVGEVIGVSVISRDVTETETAHREVEKRSATLRSFIDNTTDTFFAIDSEYKILLANNVLKARFEASNISLEEGDYIFDKLAKDQHAMWKERYDRALKGESFKIEEERKVNDNTLFIEIHVNPITDESGLAIGVTVISKDITRWKQAIDGQLERQDEITKLKASLGVPLSAKDQVLRNAISSSKPKVNF